MQLRPALRADFHVWLSRYEEMERLTQSSKRRVRQGIVSDKKPSALNSKGFISGLFVGLAILFAVSVQYTQDDVFIRFLLATMTFTFFATSVMVALGNRNATRVGYSSVGVFCVLFIYNLSVYGTVGFGILWLIAVLFATKKLFEFDSSLKDSKAPPYE